MRKQHAFTLLEILVVVVIIGILALVTVPNALKNKDSSEQTQAKEKAGMLYFGMTGYLSSMPRRDAETTWASMSEADRYTALMRFLSSPPPDLGSYITQGYSVTLGSDIHAKPVLTRVSDGQIISYD